MLSQRSLEEVLVSHEALEDISNMNMVHFYRDELLRVHNGENALKLLGEGIHGNFTRHGILLIRHRYAGKETVISPMWLPHVLKDESL